MLSAEAKQQRNSVLDFVQTFSAALNDALIVTTPATDVSGGEILFVNPAFTDLTGYAIDEAIGETPALLLGPNTSRRELTRIRARLAKGRRHTATLAARRKDGGDCQVQVRAFALTDPRTGAVCWAAILAKTAGHGQAAQTPRGELQAVADAVPVLLADIDAEQRYLLVNRQHEAWFEIGRDEIVGKAMHEIVGYDAYMELRPHIQRVLTGEPVEFEKDLRFKTVGSRFVRISLIPKQGDDGAVTGFYSLTEDISAFKRAEGALYDAMMESEAASQAKSEFLTHMSHELRTPLNAIMGFSETMKLGLFGTLEPRYQEYTELINSSADHLLDLINGLLDLAKIEANRFELSEEQIDIGPLVEEAASLTRARRDKNCAPVEINLPADFALLTADRRALRQMLLNLLSNASKFTPADGLITLSADIAPSGALRILIRDTGVGIAPDELETVFEPFGQAVGAERRSLEAGTGLGLPLVKSLIELHGGSLELESEVEVGTTVTLTFPANRVVARDNNQPRQIAIAP